LDQLVVCKSFQTKPLETARVISFTSQLLSYRPSNNTKALKLRFTRDYISHFSHWVSNKKAQLTQREARDSLGI